MNGGFHAHHGAFGFESDLGVVAQVAVGLGVPAELEEGVVTIGVTVE